MASIGPALLKDIPVDYHDRPNFVVGTILDTQNTIALLFQLLIIYAIVKQGKDMPIDTMFILSLCSADALLSTAITILGWSWDAGRLRCLLLAEAIIYSLGVSILSLCSLTLYRYLICCHQIYFSTKQAVTLIASVWLSIGAIMLVYNLIPGFVGTGVALQGSGLYCALAFWAIEDPPVCIAVSIALCVIVCPILFISFAYFSITKKYMQSKKQKILDRIPSTIKAQFDIETDISHMELILIKKSCILTGSYLVCWLPYLFKIGFETVSSEFDMVCSILGTFNTIANALVLYFYDAKTRNSVLEVFDNCRKFVGLDCGLDKTTPSTSVATNV